MATAVLPSQLTNALVGPAVVSDLILIVGSPSRSQWPL